MRDASMIVQVTRMFDAGGAVGLTDPCNEEDLVAVETYVSTV